MRETNRHHRRLNRERPRETIRWAALFAVWIHMGFVTAVFLTPPPTPEQVFLVTRWVPSSSESRLPPPGDAPGTHTDQASGGQVAERQPRAEVDETTEDDTEDEDFVSFARTDGLLVAPPTDPIAIAARDSWAHRNQRTPVTSDDVGPATPLSQGRDHLPGTPTQPRAGEPSRGAGGASAGAARSRRGGARGEDVGAGAPGLGPGRAEAGEAALASAAGAPLRSSGIPAPTTPEASHAPGWWQPLVQRVQVQHAPAPDPGMPALQTATAVAMVRAAPGGTDVGGSDQLDEAPPAPGEEEDTTGQAEEGEADEGWVDPVSDLRAALGWGDLDRSRLAPRPDWAGELGGEGARHTSPQTALDNVPISWRTSINARGTDLGAYIERVENIVVKRWAELDLPTHERAMGIQGQVTVQYSVNSRGQVSGVRVLRSSGNMVLDTMAMTSIPQRLPRIPKALGEDRIQHRVVLRYRNPLIGLSEAG